MSFDAYSVAVKIRLTENVTSGLLGLSRHFRKVDADAAQLEKRLRNIQKLTLVGGAMVAGGALGLGILGKTIKSASEYAHQLNILNMAGWTQRDIAVAVGDAWKNTGTVITTTATENLRTLLDLKNILGTMGEARMALPIVSRIQAVLASSSEGQIAGNSKNLAYGMAKALDIIGAAQNSRSFETQAEMMAKVIIATQGRVTPESFRSVFQYARQARYGLTNEFKYQILPSLIQENAAGGSGGGGGSRGVGPMLAAFYRTTNQGYINKKALPELEALGLVSASSALSTTTQGTTVGKFKAADLAAANPFLWVQSVLMPAIERQYHGHATKEQIQGSINNIFRGNQLGAALALEFSLKPQNFLRDQANIIRTMSTADAYRAAISSDPNTAQHALGAQWENFKTSLMMSVVPVLVPALIKVSSALMDMAKWARENQPFVTKMVYAFAGLSTLSVVAGGMTLFAGSLAALKLITAATGPGSLVGGIAAFTSGLVSLGAVLAAGGAGYVAGTGLNWLINKGVSHLTNGQEDSLGGWIYDATHPSPVIHNHFHVDGKEITHHVINNIGSKPATGASGLNQQKSPLRPSLNGAPGL